MPAGAVLVSHWKDMGNRRRERHLDKNERKMNNEQMRWCLFPVVVVPGLTNRNALGRGRVMPRPPRIDAPGSLFHVMARGNDRQKTFLDAQDYQAFFRALSEQKQKTPFLIYAFCLMPNHFHLLMETQRISLSVIMQRLLGRWCQA